jgi:hypothetical protein
VTDGDVVEWVETTCLLFGARRSTALKVAAEFAAAFERGEISTTALAGRPAESTDGETR